MRNDTEEIDGGIEKEIVGWIERGIICSPIFVPKNGHFNISKNKIQSKCLVFLFNIAFSNSKHFSFQGFLIHKPNIFLSFSIFQSNYFDCFFYINDCSTPYFFINF